MNLLLLYFLFLKATVTSFNGPSSLPILRQDLVVRRQILTDRQLNAAVVAGRCAPGPMGIYVVGVGYFIGGLPGACAGWLALITPAFLIVPLLRYVGNNAEHPRVRSTLQAVVIASSGLILSSAKPMAMDAIHGLLPLGILIAAIVLLVVIKVETVWIIAGAAIIACLVKAAS
ncbi:MAG: chromate transporter [Bryobacteraceae bacterium]